jgi:radical SAM protein with 4Fe4S-binding SPASM domain
MTQDNAHELEPMLDDMEGRGLDRFYLSHLNYAGRGNHNRGSDAIFQATRDALDLLFDRAWADAQKGGIRDYVTGNNDADGVYFLMWVEKNLPDRVDDVRQMLARWGGNSSGVNIANIDNLGNVHPDTMWWHHNLGNVRERAFSDIWPDTSDPLMAGLKQKPRAVKGRCASCSWFDVCGGNTRVRAWQLTGDAWAEDPGCYLTDEEIGNEQGGDRLKVISFAEARRLKQAG